MHGRVAPRLLSARGVASKRRLLRLLYLARPHPGCAAPSSRLFRESQPEPAGAILPGRAPSPACSPIAACTGGPTASKRASKQALTQAAAPEHLAAAAAVAAALTAAAAAASLPDAGPSMREERKRVPPAVVLAVLGLGLLAVLAAWLQASRSSCGSDPTILRGPAPGLNCGHRPQLRAYAPSTWERESSALNGSASACEHADQPERVNAWLTAVKSQAAPRSRDVFSSWSWEDECTGDTFVQHIEPLVGHFRWAGAEGRRCRARPEQAPPGRRAGQCALGIHASQPDQGTPCPQPRRHPLGPHCRKNYRAGIESRCGRRRGAAPCMFA